MATNIKPPLLVITGPTASGKSAYALDLAQRHDGVIINADASQTYADFNILSARPAPADLARAPHRLYGCIDGAQSLSAAQWADMARREIAHALAQGQLPILVGGTGLYIRILLDGIAPVPPIRDEIRTQVRALSLEDLQQELCKADPEMAQRLDPRNRQRLARALEVVWSSGRSLADWQAHHQGGIAHDMRVIGRVIDMDRATLNERCATRLSAMIANGAIAEVAHLAQRGISLSAPVWKIYGARPILRYLEGEINLETAQQDTLTAIRQYSRRQRTWYRNQFSDWPQGTPASFGNIDI